MKIKKDDMGGRNKMVKKKQTKIEEIHNLWMKILRLDEKKEKLLEEFFKKIGMED